MTLKLATTVQADRIIWSTGAVFLNGESEAEVMLRVALEKGGGVISPKHLREISLLDSESKDTFTSIQQLEKIINKEYAGINKLVYLVTSANHAPRVARDAAIVFDNDPDVIVSVVPCYTSYGRRSVKEVIIRDLGE